MSTLEAVLKAGKVSAPRAFRVFISSTFADMRGEREELVKRVFPELRRRCEARGVAWGEVDLRWGITSEQRAEGRVLPICLDEIERCRPYFIGLLGERYGWDDVVVPAEVAAREPWIAEHPGRSITELEILRALLPADRVKARFYFRDPAQMAVLSDEQRRLFIETERPEEVEKLGLGEARRRAAERRRKLDELKSRIRVSGAVVREDYRDARQLGDLVLADLSALLDSAHPEGSTPSPEERETALHEAHAWSLAEVEVSSGVTHGVYVARPGEGARLDEHALSSGPPLVVDGPPGIGKSALLANWALRYRQLHPGTQVFFHSVGASSRSTTALGTLRRLVDDLGSLRGIRFGPGPQPVLATRPATAFDSAGRPVVGLGSIPRSDQGQGTLEELDTALQIVLGTLGRLAHEERIVIVLDGLDHLEDRGDELDLDWLQDELPPSIRLIVSAAPGRALDALRRRAWQVLELAELSHEERLEVVRRTLAGFRKTLEPARARLIARHSPSSLPLFLRVLLEEVRLLDSPQVLDAALAQYCSAASVAELFGLVLARLENDYERDRAGLVREALGLLSAARRGLSETEIRELLGREASPLPMAVWAPLRLALGAALLEAGGLQMFAHPYLREAVAGRYAPDPSSPRALHARLAHHFEHSTSAQRRTEELPWQLAHAGEWERLADVLSEPAVFAALGVSDEYELRSYWVNIERHTGRSLSGATRPMLGRGTELSPELLAALEGTAWSQGNYEEARLALEELIQRFEPMGETVLLATLLRQSADIHIRLGHEPHALELLARARRIFERNQDLGGEADCLRLEAANLMRHHEFERALRCTERSSAIADQLEDRRGKRVDLTNRAACLTMLGRGDEAEVLHAEEALLARELRDWDGLARHLNNRGNLYLMRRDLERALECYREAEQLAVVHANVRSELVAVAGQAQVNAAQGRFDEAYRLSARVRKLAESMRDPEAIAKALFLQSTLVPRLSPAQLESLRGSVVGDPELHGALRQALESQARLADDWHEIDEVDEEEDDDTKPPKARGDEGEARHGGSHASEGGPSDGDALRRAARALGESPRREPAQEVAELRAQATALIARDCLQEALQAFERAEQIAAGAGLREEAMQVGSDFAGVLKRMGRLGEAVQRIHAARVLAEELGDPREIGLGLVNEAVAMWEAAVQGGDEAQLAPALELAVRARAIAHGLVDHERLAFAAGTCGLLQRFLGRTDDARRSFESALGSARASENPDALGRALLNLAGFCLETGLEELARERLTEARTLAGRFSDPGLRRQLEVLTRHMPPSGRV